MPVKARILGDILVPPEIYRKLLFRREMVGLPSGNPLVGSLADDTDDKTRPTSDDLTRAAKRATAENEILGGPL